MSFTNLASVIQDTVEALVRVGVSRLVAEKAMAGAEWDCVKDMAEANRDQQLLDLCDRYDTADIAKRYGKSPRTIRDMRKDALNRQSRRRMAAAG